MATGPSNVQEQLEGQCHVLLETDLVVENKIVIPSTGGARENSDETFINVRDGREQRTESLENETNRPSERGAGPFQETREGGRGQLRRETDKLKEIAFLEVVINRQKLKIKELEQDLSERAARSVQETFESEQSRRQRDEFKASCDFYKVIIDSQKQNIKLLRNKHNKLSKKVAQLERIGRICYQDCVLCAITWICRNKLAELKDFYCGRLLEKIIFFEGADMIRRQDLKCRNFMRMLEKCGILTHAEVIYHVSRGEKNFEKIKEAWNALRRNKEKVCILGTRKVDGFRDGGDVVRYDADDDNAQEDVDDGDTFQYVVIMGIMFGILGMMFGTLVMMRMMMWMMIMMGMWVMMNVNDSEDIWDDGDDEGHAMVVEPMTENEEVPIYDPQNDPEGRTWLMNYAFFEKKIIDEGITYLILFPVDLEKLEQILENNIESLHFTNPSESCNETM